MTYRIEHKADGTIDQHVTCQHRIYGLSCDDFAGLLARASSACEVCGRSDARLHIDHDHDSRHVRGLVCHGCNVILHHIDKGNTVPDEDFAAYLALTKIPMPPSKAAILTPFRVRKSTVEEIDAIAEEDGLTRSDVIRDLLALGLRAWDRGER